MDEAKTMLSIGSHYENIVNLQGITIDMDVNQGTVTQVCCFLGQMLLAQGFYSILTLH